MPSFQLHQGFAAQSIRCNPWSPTQYIISASQHYGVVGSGKVYVVNTTPGFPAGTPVPSMACWGTPDGAFDACFSEAAQGIVAVACGDGVKVYNVEQAANKDGVMPLIHNMEHQAEVCCVVWNSGKRDTFFSSSWDATIKMYSAVNAQASIVTMQEHFKEVYEVATTARSPTSILSCSGDGTWKLWDVRTPQRSVMTQMAHQNQIVLSIDFNKMDPNIFASGGVDRTVRLWDARRPNQPLASLPGHDQACRRVRFSPHSRTLLASAGYDMRVCVWDLNQPQRPMTARYQQHREFVVGLDWSIATPNALASASFDGSAFFLTVGQPPTPSPPQPLPQALPPPRMPKVRTSVLPGLPQPQPPLPMAPGLRSRSPPLSPRSTRASFSLGVEESSAPFKRTKNNNRTRPYSSHTMPREPQPRSRSSGSARSQKGRPVSTSETTKSAFFSVQDRRHHHKVLQETQQRRARLLPLGARDVALRQFLYNNEVGTVLDEGVVTARAAERERRTERRQGRSTQSSSTRVQFKEPSPDPTDGFAPELTSSAAASTSTTTTAVEASSLTAQLRAAAEKRYTESSAVTDLNAMSDDVTDTIGATGSSAAYTTGGVLPPRITTPSDDMVDWFDQDAPPQKEMDYEAWMEAGCPTGCWKDLLENELYGPERAEKTYLALKYRPQQGT